MSEKLTDDLFGKLEPSKAERLWNDMPEYHQEDLTAKYQFLVSFETEADIESFSNLVGQKLSVKTRSFWYPKQEIGRMTNKRFIDES
jgi:hypothetical protein